MLSPRTTYDASKNKSLMMNSFTRSLNLGATLTNNKDRKQTLEMASYTCNGFFW